MENEENEVIIDSSEETNEEVATEEKPVETTEEKPVVEKPKETPQAKKARLTRQLKQVDKELGVETVAEPEETITTKSDELDYGQLAYLHSKGIEDSEHDFIQGELEKFGGELKDLMSNDYFQASLKTHRDTVAVKDATPSNTRAGGEIPSSKPEFWIAQDKFPEDTPENTQLRRDIVNKKIEIDKKTGMFTSQPIIEGNPNS